MPFLIIFILIPVIEIMVFAEVADEIGFFNALLLTFLSAILGIFVIKYQGFQHIITMQSAIQRGKVPVSEMFSTLCLVFAGILLIIPGFVTDFLGLLLLFPVFHGVLRRYINRHPDWVMDSDTGFTREPPRHTRFSEQSGVIEGEYERVDEEKPGSS